MRHVPQRHVPQALRSISLRACYAMSATGQAYRGAIGLNSPRQQHTLPSGRPGPQAPTTRSTCSLPLLLPALSIGFVAAAPLVQVGSLTRMTMTTVGEETSVRPRTVLVLEGDEIGERGGAPWRGGLAA
eukprot:168152-Rhodomonas_salina.2